MKEKINMCPSHSTRTIYRKKNLFCFTLLISLFIPFSVHSDDRRGIELTSKHQIHDKAWGTYYALIIGINAYKEWNPLRTAVHDAEVLKETLVNRYGFDEKNVILRTEGTATRSGLINDLRNLASSLGGQDNLMIYFAGHGQLDDLTGNGYWIPVEGKLKDPTTWISHLDIKSILCSEKVLGKNIVLVADSCYSGSFLRGGPSLLPLADLTYQEKLAKAASHRSRQVITSGGMEPVADGGKDGHSLFAYYFLKALKENKHAVIDIENLFHSRVWEPVTEIGEQRPNVGRLKTPMDDDGQFVLIDRLQPYLEAERKGQAEEHRQGERLRALEEERKRLETERQLLESEKKLLEESKRLEAERLQLENERQKLARLETEKKLLEESKRMEAERQRIEKEKELLEKRKNREAQDQDATKESIKLASIPKSVSVASVSLRKEGKLLGVSDVKNVLITHGFYEKSMNPLGDFKNDFIDNNNGTVTDRVTGLMWQKSGSQRSVDRNGANRYLNKLNKDQFAGYSDWRLPTIEEIASLLEQNKKNGIHVNSIFDIKQYKCWSSDEDPHRSDFNYAWYVSFEIGEFMCERWMKPGEGGWLGYPAKDAYIRAVRSFN